ncbi:MAG: NADH-quinone oxidoreductase subunit N [Frankiales bacterium]|nr:NADH-quinone oxidoreductase subunit N [Frankiales bacterium]
MIQSIDYAAISPPVALAIAALVVLVADLFVPDGLRHRAASAFALVGTLVALGLASWLPTTRDRRTFCLPAGCSYVADHYAAFFQVLVLAVLVVVLLLSFANVEDDRLPAGEFYFLLLASVTGMLTLAASRDLVSLLVSLEVVSLPAFVLVGLRRADPRGGEAALKFFLFSVVSTALTVYGMALLYGVTRTLQVDAIATALRHVHAAGGPRHSLAAAAVVLVVVGFAFKISAVPFHFWAPDTYQGAPTPVAAFLSTASKAAGLAGLLILLIQAFPSYADTWGPVVAVLAAVSMTVGNLVALRQWQLVRLLAWSTVAQSGYLLLPLGVAATAGGRTPVELAAAGRASLAYLAIYAVMNIGAFACVVAVAHQLPRLATADVRGLVRRRPLLAVAFALFLTALAGLPPGVAGLFAKVVVLRAAVHGHASWLAVVAAVNTVIGLAYYLRVAAVLFTDAPGDAAADDEANEQPLHRRRISAAGVAVALAAIGVVVLSIDPQPLLHAASTAAGGLRRTVLP